MKNILMNTEMTKAILDGRKVQTRRVIKNTSYGWTPRQFCEIHKMKDGEFVLENGEPIVIGNGVCNDDGDEGYVPKYQIGETIWVREPAKVLNLSTEGTEMFCEYLADGHSGLFEIPDRIFKNHELPRWVTEYQGIPNGCIKEMARIFLKVTDVRVERLQNISEDDIQKEGVTVPYEAISLSDGGISYYGNKHSLISEWIKLWNKTALKGYKWEDNPYIFVYEFERVDES